MGDGLYGSNLRDMPMLARDRVRFVGERVAAVAAIDEDTAQTGTRPDRRGVRGDARRLRPRRGDAAGRARHPPRLQRLRRCHGDTGPRSLRRPAAAGDSPANIYTYAFGQTAATSSRGSPRPTCIIENTYYTQRQHQGYLEPQNCAVAIEHDWADQHLGRQQDAARHQDRDSPRRRRCRPEQGAGAPHLHRRRFRRQRRRRSCCRSATTSRRRRAARCAWSTNTWRSCWPATRATPR